MRKKDGFVKFSPSLFFFFFLGWGGGGGGGVVGKDKTLAPLSFNMYHNIL